MATIKSYTDLSQSRKLAEILPLESADMYWKNGVSDKYIQCFTPFVIDEYRSNVDYDYDVPCWSLAALIEGLPDGTDIIKDKADTENEKYMCTVGVKDDIISTFGNNPVDACVAMIERLHKLNLL